jgi:hypothetical protein
MSSPVVEETIEEVVVSDAINESDPLLKNDNRTEESPASNDEDTEEGDLKPEFYRLAFWKRPNPWLLSWMFFVLMCSVTVLMAAQVDRTIELVCDEELGLISLDERDLRCREPGIMAKVATLSLRREILKGVLAFAVLPRLVSLGDRVGRLPLIIFCAVNTLVSHILEAMCFSSTPILNYRVLYVTSVLQGLGAGIQGIAVFAFPYISDCVKDSKRARHFTLMEGIQFLAIAIAPNLGSRMFKSFGNMNLLMALSVGGDLVAAILFVTLLVESRSPTEKRISRDIHTTTTASALGRTFLSTLLDALNIFKPLRALTFPHIQDKSARRTAIFVVTTKFVILITLLFAAAPLDLLMEMIYQWRASELGVVIALSGIAGAVSLTVIAPVGLYVFGKLYKTFSTEIDKVDIRLIQFCATAVLLGAAMMAFAGNWMVFLVGACIIQISTMASPIILSVVVKYAEKKHIGLVFGAMNQIVQLSTIIATTTSLSVFQHFIDTDPRITLHVSSVVMGFFLIVLVTVLR